MVPDDVTLNVAKGNITVLSSLDLSAALDTINNTIFSSIVYLCVMSLNWFTLYVTGSHLGIMYCVSSVQVP